MSSWHDKSLPADMRLAFAQVEIDRLGVALTQETRLSLEMTRQRDQQRAYADAAVAVDDARRAGIAELQAEITKLETECASLRKLHEARCERLAAASEVIGRNAEKNALARLEAWVAEDREIRHYVMVPGSVQIGSENHSVHGYSCPSAARYHNTRFPELMVVVGTDDAPASVATCILAALAKMESLYGG